MKMVSHLCSLWCTALLFACSSGTEAPSEKSMNLLDPSTAHEGRTYAEWAAAWVQYVYSYTKPDCLDPINDLTGEHCELYQDPNSPVFFLVGTYGGVAQRTLCNVPGNKELFFPLVNTWTDNTGLPPDQLLSDAEAKANTESQVALIIESKLFLKVDGRDIDRLNRGLLPSAPYVLHLPPEPNSLTCQGASGFVGDFPGYVGGYFVMLPALGPGAHTISFGGAANKVAGGEMTIDIRYDFTSP